MDELGGVEACADAKYCGNVGVYNILKARGAKSPDIINDVLTYLPFKSLIQFKCVCKLWRSSISDPKKKKKKKLKKKDRQR
ncbi:hypothetical protein NC651_036642 [Populus alba x Populus x berolinensis]|nr:hypothetical protein NC651_036642 [Populus alba x Populus x berolinensis]